MFGVVENDEGLKRELQGIYFTITLSDSRFPPIPVFLYDLLHVYKEHMDYSRLGREKSQFVWPDVPRLISTLFRGGCSWMTRPCRPESIRIVAHSWGYPVGICGETGSLAYLLNLCVDLRSWNVLSIYSKRCYKNCRLGPHLTFDDFSPCDTHQWVLWGAHPRISARNPVQQLDLFEKITFPFRDGGLGMTMGELWRKSYLTVAGCQKITADEANHR